MRERIGPWLYPWLPLFVLVAVWVRGNAARLNAAEEQAYSPHYLPTLIRNMLAEQAEESAREDQAGQPMLTSGLASDQRELFDGE